MKREQIIGGAAKTGVFLKKGDFDQLVEVIAKAVAKDKLLKKYSIKTVGRSNIGKDSASMGTASIQKFVQQLAKLYDLPQDNGEFYGVNKYGEFMRWVSVQELGQKVH